MWFHCCRQHVQPACNKDRTGCRPEPTSTLLVGKRASNQAMEAVLVFPLHLLWSKMHKAEVCWMFCVP
jgi:hypothetical protein